MRRFQLEAALRALCRAVAADASLISGLDSDERNAVALILNRPELLDAGGTMLYAAWRLERGWLDVCWDLQREGWRVA